MASFASIPMLADYLVTGFWAWVGSQGTLPRHWTASTITVNITDLTPAEQALAISALNAWHEVANISFVFTTGPAQITYNNNGSHIAGTSLTVSGTTLTSAAIQISSDWWPNDNIYSYMYQAYLHETGHALGLGHQGPYNSSATYGINNIYTNDTWQWSLMSYFSQKNFGGASYDYVITPQMADIYAIQSIYGASNTRTGDTTYGFNCNAGSIYDFNKYQGGTPAFTIYDSGGTDTLNCSGYSADQTIDLVPGDWSSVGGYVSNIGIYLTSVIENAVGGSGNDLFVLTATNTNNLITGGPGFDRVILPYNFGTGYTASGTEFNLAISGQAGDDSFIGIEEFQFVDGSIRSARELLNLPSPDPTVIAYQKMFGFSVAEAQLPGLLTFQQNQYNYAVSISVQDPTIYVFEASGLAFARGSAFENQFGPAAIQIDVSFATLAWQDIFHFAPDTGLVQWITDHVDYYETIYLASGAYGSNPNDIELLARGATYGLIIGQGEQSGITVNISAMPPSVSLVGISDGPDSILVL
jgi:hypothetical protein